MALNAAAQRFFDNSVATRVKQVLEASLTKLVVERLCLAARSNGNGFISELPAQLTMPDNSLEHVRLTVMPMAVEDGPRLAVLYIRRMPQEQLVTEAYAKLPKELLSWLPVPSWLINEDAAIVFESPFCPELPLSEAAVSLVDDVAQFVIREDSLLGVLDESISEAVKETSEAARAERRLADKMVTTGGQVWRIVHIPIQGLDRKSYLLGLGLRMTKNVSGARIQDYAGADQERRRRMQLLERERERMKLAREVHDSLGQELTVLRLGMDRLMDTFKSDLQLEPKHLEQFDLLKTQMHQAISSSRQIAFQLRTDLLQTAGLLHAIENLVAQFRQRLDISGQLEVSPGWEDPKSTLAGNIYRSIQELLSNMAKHARASRFIVRLQMNHHSYQVEVVDDGVGIPREKRKGHLGLHTMRERVEYHRGEMRIKTRPEVSGTGVTLTFMHAAVDYPETNF